MLRRHNKGFTLLEVLVASGVSLLLGVCVLASFIQSRRSFESAEGTIEMVRAARPAMDRVSQYVGSAVSIAGEDTILYPPVTAGPGVTSFVNERGQTVDTNDPSTWSSYIVFRTTEDFLSPGFDPDEIMDLINGAQGFTHAQLMDTYKTNAQPVYDYILWWEDENLDKVDDVDNALMLARVAQVVDAAGNTVFREADWAGTSGDPWADLEPTINPRIIARGGGKDGVGGLEEVNFLHQMSNGVNISIQAGTDVRMNVGTEHKVFRLEGLIQIPSISMQQ